MAKSETASAAAGFPVRVAVRMTGLKPELLRAWEVRHGAVQPARTPGGSRRYSAADLERLKLLREVVESGHQIGKIAHLSTIDLQALLGDAHCIDSDSISQIIAAGKKLDGAETSRILTAELARVGSFSFATDVALPLLAEIGERWARGRISISGEHLILSVLRSILMPLVSFDEGDPGSPKVVFATPSGERHDLGTLVASLVATKVGVVPSFVGADVPADDLCECTIRADASVLVLGLVTLDKERAATVLREIRKQLPVAIEVWIGGRGIEGIPPITGVVRIDNLGQLEAHLTRLKARGLTSDDETDAGLRVTQ